MTDRILEIGDFAAGFCGRLFVQAGSEVVRLDSGSPAPGWVRPAASDLYLHAGKRRVQTSDPAMIAELAAQADVVIMEGDSADAVVAAGFDSWSARVKVAITPFGRTGPKRNWLATPHVLLAMGGYTGIMGDPGRAPLSLPGHYTEFQAGQYAYIAANACRVAGDAGAIDVSTLETVLSLSQFTTVQWHCRGEIRRRHGNDLWSVCPSNMYPLADGWACVTIVPGFWDAFTIFLDRPELAIDERFGSNDARMANRDALHALIAESLLGVTRDEAEQRAEAARIPLGVVKSLDEILADPHLAYRDYWRTVQAPDGARVYAPGPAYRIETAATAPAQRQTPKLSPSLSCGRAARRTARRTGAMTDGPLSGVRILDLTHVWAGPLAVRTLADLGADVVKIEAPHGRGPAGVTDSPIGGWLAGDPADDPWNRNAAFVKLMRNRRSVCIDLKASAGRELLLSLVAVSDVVVENFSARGMRSLGLDYATLKSANPQIIYVTMPGYGTTGPYADRVAFGPTVEPLSGLTSLMGYSAEEPRNTAMALLDPITALYAASGVMAALRRRQASGQGALVELSLHEAGVSYSGPWLIEHQLGGTVQPIGNRHPQMAPHGVYPCAGTDQWLALACWNDDQWRALCALVGGNMQPGATLAERHADHDEIDRMIAAWTSTEDKVAVAGRLQTAGIAAGPVNTTPDITGDPQVQHRAFFVPLEEQTPVPGNPVRMDATSSADWTPCPGLGAHNAQVLSEWLGRSDAEVTALMRAGVLADRPPD